MVAIMRPLLVLATLVIAATAASAQTMTPESGVPLDVATRRAANISGLRYEMSLSIPAQLATPLTGEETIRFDLKDGSGPLVIDFDTSRPDGMERKFLDVTRLTGLGWRAHRRLRDGLTSTYADYLNCGG